MSALALRRLTIALLLLAALRLAQVLCHAPLAGYANQYDMVRAHACLGLWPAAMAPGQASPEAPIAMLRGGAVDPANCHRSTDVLIAQAAFALPRLAAWFKDTPDGEFLVSLRWVGALKALLLVALVLLLDHLLAQVPRARLLHAVSVAVILADPLDTLFLHTLYTEFGALLGAYALLAAVWLLHRRLHGRAALLLLGWGALALALSRFQHLPVLLALAALALGPVGPSEAPRRLRAFALGAALLLGVASHQDAQQRIPGIPAANRADTLFGALLPASTDPEALVARLGLPSACVALGGSNWYVPRGQDLQAACPAAFALSHAQIGWALLAEPLTALRALAIAVPQSTAWRLNYLGEVAGGVMQRVAAPSLGDAMASRALWVHWVFWGLPLLAGGLALRGLWRAQDTALPALQLACALTIAGGWAASVFGDGYSELARHLHLAVNAALLGWLLWLASVWGSGQHRASAALTLPLVLAASWAGLGLPAASARLTVPATDALGSAGLEQDVAGWVLAPGATVTGLALCQPPMPIAQCRHTALLPDSAVSTFFPVAGAAAAWRFQLRMPLKPGILEAWLLHADGSQERVLRHTLREPGALP